MDTNVETLSAWISQAKNAVFFGGAGVSTASGIPDFRSAHGLYHQNTGGRSYEDMLSIGFFTGHPDEFWDFYRSVMLYPDAKPNPAHFALARLEKQGILKAVITQNIDGLHQAAGSQKVLELHGTVHKNRCTRCGKAYGLPELLHGKGAPRCACGGVIKPEVVLYGEGLDEDVLEEAVRAIAACDLLLVGGTSLVVYPAAGLIRYRKADCKTVLLNQSETSMDGAADLVIREDIAAALDRALKQTGGGAA